MTNQYLYINMSVKGLLISICIFLYYTYAFFIFDLSVQGIYLTVCDFFDC